MKTTQLLTTFALAMGALSLNACVAPEDGGSLAGETDGSYDDAQALDVDVDINDDYQSASDDETKANWNLSATPQGSNSFSVAWEAVPGDSFKLCWKKDGQFGDACNKNSANVNVTWSNWWSGYVYAGIYGLECETAYKIKVKKGLFKTDSVVATTGSCSCANPCPSGGSYDGANCWFGTAPSGTTAFIWSNNYYYSALPGNSCPVAGSWYDGANCYLQAVPAGVDPFIWNNGWYYEACP